jgi:uncharacterized protein with HEPN domain
MSRDATVWLADIVEACDRISEYVVGLDELSFRADRKTVDAVVRNLEVIGEAVKHLPESMRTSAPNIEWRRIAGLRDILAHAYFGIDEAIVWSIVTTKVPALRTEVGRMMGPPTDGS